MPLRPVHHLDISGFDLHLCESAPQHYRAQAQPRVAAKRLAAQLSVYGLCNWRRLEKWYLPFQTSVQGPSRSVLGREYTNATAATNFKRAIEQIKHRESGLHVAHAGYRKILGGADVDLDVIGQVAGVCEPFAQAALIQPVKQKVEPVPSIGRAR